MDDEFEIITSADARDPEPETSQTADKSECHEIAESMVQAMLRNIGVTDCLCHTREDLADCINAKHGCIEHVCPDRMAAHRQLCRFERVVCRVCQETMSRRELVHHQMVCGATHVEHGSRTDTATQTYQQTESQTTETQYEQANKDQTSQTDTEAYLAADQVTQMVIQHVERVVRNYQHPILQLCRRLDQRLDIMKEQLDHIQVKPRKTSASSSLSSSSVESMWSGLLSHVPTRQVQWDSAPHDCIHLMLRSSMSVEIMLNNVHRQESIWSLKQRIERQCGWQASLQHLVFNGHILKDHEDLVTCGVRDGSTLHVVLRKSHSRCSQ